MMQKEDVHEEVVVSQVEELPKIGFKAPNQTFVEDQHSVIKSKSTKKQNRIEVAY
jgi:hypothetical protein